MKIMVPMFPRATGGIEEREDDALPGTSLVCASRQGREFKVEVLEVSEAGVVFGVSEA